MPKLPSPTQNPDWVIAEAAEKQMKPIKEVAGNLGITEEELLLHGHYVAKVDYKRVLDRLADRPDGKYIDVTAITPTPLGEGKSTTTMGLLQGMGKRGLNVTAAIRQPSGGPTMNIKGSAAGGGLSQCVPLTPFSLGLTGDINAIMNAHNLAMVAVTSRLQHERNYNDEQLLRLSGMPRLDLDPTNIEMGWIIDFCARPSAPHRGLDRATEERLHDALQVRIASPPIMAIWRWPDIKVMRKAGAHRGCYSKKGKPIPPMT